MLTKHRRRNRVLTLAVLTLLVGLPELAFAQQSGLFPNAPIRRVRPSCDQEDSIYKLYKHQYYGYHPTCWRKFPDGWGCPSSEAPDKEKSFREIERNKPQAEAPPEDGDDAAPKDDMDRPADKPKTPSPFEMPAVPDDTKSPFDLKDPAPGAGPANPPQTNRMPTAPGGGTPDLAPPATGRTTSNRRSGVRDEGANRPILAMSDEIIPIPDAPADAGAVIEGGELAPVADAPARASNPSQPPARRSMLGTLFGGNGWNWRRR